MLSKSQVKYIQSLGQKKCRDQEGLFIAEGPKIVSELIQQKNCRIKQIYATAAWCQKNNSVQAEEITEAELERISQLKTPHEVLLIAEKFHWHTPLQIRNTITLLLDSVQDPGNLGTIIRLADWFTVSQMLCSHGCADIYNPKVVQSSMGSLARVRVEYVDLPAWVEKHKKEVPVYAATLRGADVSKMQKINEGILIIGNESRGISNEILELTDQQITIPRKGKAESLNAAVAAGIILSHLCS